jgi:Trypsin
MLTRPRRKTADRSHPSVRWYLPRGLGGVPCGSARARARYLVLVPVLLLLTGAVAAAIFARSASAITNGTLDGNRHPNVGALLAEWRTPGVKEELCTGTLISPTVFLTASHCTAYLESLGIPTNQIWVSFDQDVDPVTSATTLYQGHWVTNPGFNHRQSDPGDIAVVLFDTPIQGVSPAALPPAGLFDHMKADDTLEDQQYTAVGYGDRERQNGGGQPFFPFDGQRYRAVSSSIRCRTRGCVCHKMPRIPEPICRTAVGSA